jgi:glutathione S-transferase
MLGDHITIADFYLFVLGRWGLRLQTPTSTYPNLMRLILEMASKPSVLRAMEQEGISLDHPKSGLG